MKVKLFPIFLAFTLISFIKAVEQGDNALVWVDVEKDEKDESTTDQTAPTLSDELFRPTSEWQEIKPGKFNFFSLKRMFPGKFYSFL